MWGGVLSLVRQGLIRRRPRRRTTARVVDESALGEAAAEAGDVAARGATAAAPGAQLARAVLAMARGAVVRLDGGRRGAEEAWAAASGWRPARAADEVGHLMVRESLRYVIYA
ncbi:hypothetical protein BDA96_06G128700 [Sorghum bicolor]|jgi:hypothetical protein|uniref:Uncharacterized protein n=2 Tax=Sorghum bicolor TaxID=4558 RepID=A0A921UD72_SORBI|nr:uncharacterized protein LOC8073566 [Sorghum bicolor]KAG0526241.1 hypothetical protein BDA96_06G128700 [Sorghum bicolor]OQU81767.1 hypothetical protein SORBI_3006G116050 [Sorghum bicolor]|eukprot:XP_002448020.1 uncharacterized protein LOC8073566 [Sorghum bicolor]